MPPTTYQRALEEVGTSLKKNMVWLLKFHRLCLDDLSHVDRVRLCEEIYTFSMLGSSLDVKEFVHTKMPWIDQPEAPELNFGFSLWWKRAVSVQAIVQRAIESLMQNGQAAIVMPESEHVITRENENQRKSKKRSSSPNDYVLPPVGPRAWELQRGPFLFRLIRVLAKCKDELDYCHAEDCRTIFHRKRSDQTYCLEKCRLRITMRKIRAESKNKGGRRDGKSRR